DQSVRRPPQQRDRLPRFVHRRADKCAVNKHCQLACEFMSSEYHHLLSNAIVWKPLEFCFSRKSPRPLDVTQIHRGDFSSHLVYSEKFLPDLTESTTRHGVYHCFQDKWKNDRRDHPRAQASWRPPQEKKMKGYARGRERGNWKEPAVSQTGTRRGALP